MAYNKIKPFFPASPESHNEESWWNYLCSVGVGEGDFDTCCVKEGKITGIDSLQSVSLICDGESFSDVPVWIHTDVGARTSVYENQKDGSTAELTASEYFKHSALMFPIPGCVTNGYNNEWGYGSSHTDLGNGKIGLPASLFQFDTVHSRTFDADIIDTIENCLARIKSGSSTITIEDEVVTAVIVDGVTLGAEEYRLESNNTVVCLFVAEFSGSAGTGTTRFPSECVETWVNDEFTICESLYTTKRNPDNILQIYWVKIAPTCTTSPLVQVMITNKGGVKSAIGVIGIVDNVTPTGYVAGNPYPTYRMYVKVDFEAIGDNNNILYGKTSLYDVIGDQIASVPTYTTGEPGLPLILADSLPGYEAQLYGGPKGDLNTTWWEAEYGTYEDNMARLAHVEEFLAKGFTAPNQSYLLETSGGGAIYGTNIANTWGYFTNKGSNYWIELYGEEKENYLTNPDTLTYVTTMTPYVDGHTDIYISFNENPPEYYKLDWPSPFANAYSYDIWTQTGVDAFGNPVYEWEINTNIPELYQANYIDYKNGAMLYGIPFMIKRAYEYPTTPALNYTQAPHTPYVTVTNHYSDGSMVGIESSFVGYETNKSAVANTSEITMDIQAASGTWAYSETKIFNYSYNGYLTGGANSETRVIETSEIIAMPNINFQGTNLFSNMSAFGFLFAQETATRDGYQYTDHSLTVPNYWIGTDTVSPITWELNVKTEHGVNSLYDGTGTINYIFQMIQDEMEEACTFLATVKFGGQSLDPDFTPDAYYELEQIPIGAYMWLIRATIHFVPYDFKEALL